jgi:hypothetical protein
VPPFSSNFLPSAVMAAPSLPADHCEITVRRGFTAWARATWGAVSRPAAPASMVRRLMLFIGPFPSYGGARDRQSRHASSKFKHQRRHVTRSSDPAIGQASDARQRYRDEGTTRHSTVWGGAPTQHQRTVSPNTRLLKQ